MTGPQAPHLDPAVRHDIVLLFDVTDGNPNGDPDGGNQPRTDEETGHGLVTDVALKRKIRDTVPLLRPGDQRYGIFVEAGHALNDRIEEAVGAVRGPEAKGKATRPDADAAQSWLCDRYFDVRMFGAVLSTGATGGAGQVRGPLQLTFARSIDPVVPVDHAITRVTQTRAADIAAGQTTEMGSKWTVPYGLYRAHAYYSGPRAAKTGVTAEDLDVLWSAVLTMFDQDRSATRGELRLGALVVFSHPNAVGVAPAAALTGRVRVERRDRDKPPRTSADYDVRIDTVNLPDGVHATSLFNVWP